VRAVIQWRLAPLSPDAHALAQTAAVIGRKFSLDVLARASGLAEAAVLHNLDELWRRQIIRTQDGDGYDFSHDGMRAVAYDEMGPIHRRALHLRVAQALEQVHADELDAWSGQIAAHYEQAGQPQPAIAFYRRAAAAARQIYANAEAVRLYRYLLESKLNAGLSLQERCTLLLALGEVWQATGYWVKAQAVDLQALDAAERLGDAHLQAQAQAALASVLHLQGYYDEALDRLARAEQGFQSIGEWRGVVSTLGTTGHIYWFRGDHLRAQAALERQHQIAAEIGDARGMCEALESLGMVQSSQGDLERSAESCLQAIAVANALDYKPIITRASITLGNVRLEQAAVEEAVGWYLHAGLLARHIDDRQALSWAISNIAMVLARRGDYERALAGYQRSLRNAWEIGDRWTACRIVAALATVHQRQGSIERAESLYRKAIDLKMWLGTPGYLAGMLVSLARLLLDQGRAVEAQALYRQASGMMASAGVGRLAGEDMRFDLRVLDIRIRHALGELTSAQVRAALHAQAPKTVAPLQQAAVQYELWRLAHDDEVARVKAATLYREQYHETGAEDCRTRFRELTGETLPDPEPLPDVSDLIPLEPGDQAGLDLEAVLADLEILLA
jgi:tetratricopeptide (TPR) repeat protein